MVECHDPKCREELINEISGKISLKNFIIVAGIFVTMSGIISGIAYKSYSGGQEDQKEAINKNTETTNSIKNDVGIIKTQQGRMQIDINKLETKIDKMNTTQQKVLQELIKLNTKMDATIDE